METELEQPAAATLNSTEETSRPIQPSTPVRITKVPDSANSVSSIIPGELSPTEFAHINDKRKRRSSVVNDEYKVPLQKKAKLKEETTSSDVCGTAAVPLQSIFSLDARAPGPRLLPSPIPQYRQRPRVGSIQHGPPQPYPPIRLAPFRFSHHSDQSNEEMYNELAHWYQQFRLQMWSPVASVMGIRWEQAEEIGWYLGWNEIMRRSSRSSLAR
ncbi:hypothetical protein OAory_01014010 [Aspergillus oryzae]|uniref:Uncharacterized protein n=3 Tax=Aspergillus oryzae TaxID=5062 RepID=A0A1S9DX76_ASPOZ|nr:hypothetical protein OAory_01014010 [Aspergillus oryzae]